MRWIVFALVLLLAGCAAPLTYTTQMEQYSDSASYSVTQTVEAIKITGQDTDSFRSEVNFTVSNGKVVAITNSSAGVLTIPALKKVLGTVAFSEEPVPIADGNCFLEEQPGTSQSAVCFSEDVPFYFEHFEVTGNLQGRQFIWKTHAFQEECEDAFCRVFTAALENDPSVFETLKTFRSRCEQHAS